jgi:fumarate reductase flavoprotein subunit
MQTDVVVIGAGFAGLATAARAGELGLKVIVLEQGADEDYMCNSRISGGYLHLCMDDPAATPSYLAAKIDQVTDGFANPDVASALAGDARRVLDWLKGHGVQFIRIGQNPGRQWVMAPPRKGQPGLDWQGRGPHVSLKRLGAVVVGHGNRILRDARATALAMTGGTCTGVHVTRDGASLHIEADAVVIADGGFQGNPELVRTYITPQPEKLMRRNAGTGRGDGLRMAAEAGARLVGTDCFYGHPLSRDAFTNDLLWPHPYLDSMVVNGIVSDARGHRFVDEGRGGVYVANVVARRADPLDAVVIFDDAVWTGPAADPTLPPMPNPTLKTSGATIHGADTIVQLAALAGIPGDVLAATVTQFNAAIQAGAQQELDPARTVAQNTRPMVMKPPFRAIPMCAGITYTMGGPAIDRDGAVQHRDGHSIQGLYAAGAATGGLEGGAHAGYVGGLAKSFIGGVRVAERIARERA